MPIQNFLHPGYTLLSHPVELRWSGMKQLPGVARLICRFSRERDGLTFTPAQFHITALNAVGHPVSEDSALWEEYLDLWLIEEGVRAISEQNEAARFGFSLERRFSSAIERFGDGYFNAVLVRFLLGSELYTLPHVHYILDRIRENRPYPGAPLDDCRKMIEGAIGSVGRDLTVRLKYDDESATRILDGALAYYLDERYSVTNRRMLGFR